MVFNATEGANDIDQPSNKSKHRKTTPTGRKGKGAVTNSSPSKEVVPSNLPGKGVFSTGLDKANMGNTSAQHPGSDLKDSKQEVFHAESNHSCVKKGGNTSNNGSASFLPSENIEEEIEKLSKEGGDDQTLSCEIARLKRLLLLQVSLISRQQDLLRLRDREIMQLKASNSNYKCQLSRVRRRMSKRRSDGQEDSPKATKRKSPESFMDQTPPKIKEVSLVNTETQTPEMMHVFNEESRPKSKKRRLEYQDCMEISSPVLKGSDSIKVEDLPGPSRASSTSDTITSSIPVPTSFIDQVQSQLVQALMISPPGKALKTFCDITSASPELPFKICDRCPHCVAFAQEIIRLFKAAENSKSIDFADLQQDEFFKLTGIASRESEFQYEANVTRKIPLMRTTTSFYRLPPSFDQNHWWWDLKCDNIVPDKTLNIPSWKVHEIVPVPNRGEDITEATDDQTYMKRHAKLELDEKRRKKWDIQRIREFRYTERLRLRQKMMKQGSVFETANIESFSGLLHDAEYVEVEESLPVNVFGHPLPHLNLGEFSLSRIRSSVTNSSRRRTKKT